MAEECVTSRRDLYVVARRMRRQIRRAGQKKISVQSRSVGPALMSKGAKKFPGR